MSKSRRRANLKDVAERAGVSMATVDRVLNERGSVKEVTVRRVRQAAQELGVEDGRVFEEFRFAVLLQDPDHLYYRALGEAISTAVEAVHGEGLRVDIHYLVETDDAVVAAKIDELNETADGIAGVFLQNTHVLAALSRAIRQGKPVVTVLTDIRHPERFAYVGLDNRAVGRTAGYLLGRFIHENGGRILLTTESLNYVGLEEREMGLRSVLLEKFPNLELTSVIDKSGMRDTMSERLVEVLADPDVRGIYNAGGRNSVIADALRTAGRNDVVFIGSELTEVSRRLLHDGRMDAVIAFPAANAGPAVCKALLAAAGRRDKGPQAYQDMITYFAENAQA